MGQYQSERRLSAIYSSIVALALTACICLAVVWNHWRLVLDVCPDENCGCILYGVSAANHFPGGHVSSCQWVVYGLLPVMGVALIMGSFHLLRVCIKDIGKYENENVTVVKQREGEMISMTTRAPVNDNDSVSYYWIPAAVVSAIFSVYSLVHASILTDGYYRTCNQYRGELIKSLRATGNQVSAIHSRLGCQAVFDFMDYLQPDLYDKRRGEFINTGLALQIALVCSWFVVFLWIAATVLNSARAHNDKGSSACCGK